VHRPARYVAPVPAVVEAWIAFVGARIGLEGSRSSRFRWFSSRTVCHDCFIASQLPPVEITLRARGER